MTAFALVDANNFYATCEKAFDPRLRDRPLVVLSNNDGCIVARSAEAKALGIPMATPIHPWVDFCRAHGVVVRSSNYTLYGDMSARLMEVLQDHCPTVEPYSIDEAFLDLTGLTDLTARARDLREAIRRRALLSCGIGIGPTRTLAKFANHVAKKQPHWGGVFNTLEHAPGLVEQLLAQCPAEDVWGVGRRLAARLAEAGIDTALALRDADLERIRQRHGAVLTRTVLELRGHACIQLDDMSMPRQQIMVSRSFGRLLTARDDLAAALTRHVSRAGEKLRAQHSTCQQVGVTLRTNPFRHDDAQYRRSAVVDLAHPTADTARLLQAALTALDSLYQPGFRYHKIGVLLSALCPASAPQADLFSHGDDPRRQRLMAVMDTLNQRHGQGTLRIASEALSERWRMRAEGRSPCYTTCWSDIPETRP